MERLGQGLKTKSSSCRGHAGLLARVLCHPVLLGPAYPRPRTNS